MNTCLLILFLAGSVGCSETGNLQSEPETSDTDSKPAAAQSTAARVPSHNWPMFGRDKTRNAVSPEKNAPTVWHFKGAPKKVVDGQIVDRYEDELNIRWAAELGSQTIGDPVVAGGLVWIGTNNKGHGKDASVLMCLRESDGKLLYRYLSPRLPDRVQDFPTTPLACSPLVEGDRMWFTTNRAETVCLDIGPLRRGEGEPRTLWKVDMREELGVFSLGSPMIWIRICSVGSYRDFVYVITGNGRNHRENRVPAPSAPSLVCFDKHTGEIIWKDSSPGDDLFLGQWASPLVVEISGRAQVLAPQGDGWIRAFDALTGTLIWKFDTNLKDPNWKDYRLGSRNNILATPVLYENRVYIGNGRHMEWGGGFGPGWLYCLDPTGEGDVSAQLVEESEHVKLNPNSKVVWSRGRQDNKKQFFGRTMSNVAIHEGLVIAPDATGFVHCLDAKTGEQYWVHDTLAAIFASPLIVDGKVYLGDEDGRVWIFALSKKKEVLAEIDMGSSVYCSPIFANGTLYIATRNRLFAIAKDELDERAGPTEERSEAKRGRRGPRAAFVPTPQDVLEKMLALAEVRKSDVVYDPGSGDGRIVMTAAQKYGCKAVGYEIDRELVEVSRERVRENKLQDLVTIERRDIFTVDLSRASVVTLYLLPRMNAKLVPQLEKLKPGSRIVAHEFPIPGLEPERVVEVVSVEDRGKRSIFLYRTPLRKQTEQ